MILRRKKDKIPFIGLNYTVVLAILCWDFHLQKVLEASNSALIFNPAVENSAKMVTIFALIEICFANRQLFIQIDPIYIYPNRRSLFSNQ